jgi:hypothetical protein
MILSELCSWQRFRRLRHLYAWFSYFSVSTTLFSWASYAAFDSYWSLDYCHGDCGVLFEEVGLSYDEVAA